MSIYPSIIYRSLIFSCNSGEDSQVYEREYIEHGNCSCCTSFAKSAELEKQRELFWKNRKKSRAASAPVAAAERDLWDPTIDVEDLGE
jgi:hypothetical protein